MTKATEAAGMRRDHRGSRERAPRRERERAREHRAGPAADAGRGPDARSGADGSRAADAGRPDGAQEAARIGDTISMMLDRLRDAAASHDEDCAPDGG